MSEPKGPFVVLRTYHRFTTNQQVDEGGRPMYTTSDESDPIEPPFDNAVLKFVEWTDDRRDGVGLVRCHWIVDLYEDEVQG